MGACKSQRYAFIQELALSGFSAESAKYANQLTSPSQVVDGTAHVKSSLKLETTA